jgi:hypothetical protein
VDLSAEEVAGFIEETALRYGTLAAVRHAAKEKPAFYSGARCHMGPIPGLHLIHFCDLMGSISPREAPLSMTEFNAVQLVVVCKCKWHEPL